MNHGRNLIAAAVMGLMASAATLAVTEHAQAADADKEKCYGVANAGKNDCAANGHACTGQSKRSGDPKEWIFLPKGTCDRVVGGSTDKPAK